MTAAVPIRPKVRYVECQPVEQQGQRSFLLTDPTGLAPNPIVVSPAVVFLLQRFDGRHTLPEIAASLKDATGEVVPPEQLEQLVRSLNEARMLDSEEFRAYRSGLLAEYREAEHRPFLHGGTAYPVEPDALRAWHGGLDARPLEGEAPAGRVVGAAAPHIDLRFGGASCRLVHDRLRHSAEGNDAVETVVVLGTGHCAAEDLFTLTRPAFQTPLGPVETDLELVDALAARLGEERMFRGELLHAKEHTVEFQAVLLRLTYGDAAPRMLPVLVGSLHEFMAAGTDPYSDARVRGFVDGLREEIDRLGRRATFLASIDLSHLGPRYGDERGLTPEQAAEVEAEDRALLALAAAGDAEGFFRHNVEREDARRVCGFSALYTLLRILPEARGTLLRYEQTTFPGTSDTVAHCAMLFTEGA